MRVLRKTVVLAFAAFGMYKAWELASPRIEPMRQRAMQAKNRIQPAVREAQTTVHNAAEDVTDSVEDLSRSVAESVSQPQSASIGTSDAWAG
jgi:hypothetical protein